ncbi:MAG: GAF domain-containing protein [Chloroflexota bacterium]
MATAHATPITTGDADVQFRAALDRLAMFITSGALLLVIGVYAVTPFLAYRWTRIPFFGAFVEPTLIFNGIGSPDWALIADNKSDPSGTNFPDRLIGIDARAVTTPAELYDTLSHYNVGDEVAVDFEKAVGSSTGPVAILGVNTVRVSLIAFPFNDLLGLFIIPYFVGLAFLVIGLWVFYLRREEAAGRAFALFCGSMAIVIGTVFDVYTTKTFAALWTAAIPLAGASLFTLGAVFPQEASYIARRPYLRWLSFAPALFIIAVAESRLVDFAQPRAYAAGWLLGYVFAALGALFFIANSAYRWWRAASPIVREQSRLILLASAGFLPVLAWILYGNFIDTAVKFNALYYFSPLILFPFGIAYSILRYRLLSTEYVLSRMLVYALLGILTTLGYILMVAGVGVLAGAAVPADSPALIALLVFAIVLAFNPLRNWLQKQLDSYFFRGRRAYQEQLQDFSRALTESVELPAVVGQLKAQIDSALKPAHVHLFLREHNKADFIAYSDSEPAGTDIHFAGDGALARTLAAQRVLYLAPDSPLPASVQRDRARLAVLGSPLFVPLNSKSGLTGWLALGGRLSGEPYSRRDLDFLEALAAQSGLAVERAQVIAALERRVNELNVLSQVSQAINFSISFDDLLELVYAQAGRVLEVRHFAIVLNEPRTRTLSYAFFVADDERDTSRERKPWQSGSGLAGEVVRTGQPILTNDYLDECARRRVPPLDRPYHAWLGVPLNSGASTLGAMTIASTDISRTFTDEQLKIFSAIADQAATAIEKARLYERTEERARQLATLNQAAQTITSTLELDPLLKSVLESAVDILNCDAGSLFLIDEETNESVFKVIVGGGGDDLAGLRIPPGRGIVGSAAESGQPVMVNDAASDPRWFQKAETTGFVSRALLAVPMRIKERTTGVVEVINKRDGSPFDEEDVALLTAFTNQAAVAIENARLFNSTDQALTARVEELSVMQRIDRELNAALDVSKIMNIVLDRALATTGAIAGAAGIVVEEGVSIIAHHGYGEAILPLLDQPIPAGRGLVNQVLNSGEPLLVTDVQSDERYYRILPDTVSQLTIPIRREDETIGVMALESDRADCFQKEDLAFLTRLADHAAIAVANAKLYAEVNAANLAKSEFVSFVSHELKTPMTSIKGYVDWLATGTVGPINDTQGQFLATIRGNVERMMTIVSDLADIARIESGRMRLEQKVTPFQTVIQDVIQTVQAQYDAKQQKLLMDVDAELPPVFGDHVRLVQVLTNLMSNATKYTPDGGAITLSVHRSNNVWDAEGAPEVLHIAVQDTGYGISPADQKKIFTKFFRAEDRVIREAPGTGLGLNIFKLLVELGGGKAWFESEQGQGSTFHFTVPLAQDSVNG